MLQVLTVAGFNGIGKTQLWEALCSLQGSMPLQEGDGDEGELRGAVLRLS